MRGGMKTNVLVWIVRRRARSHKSVELSHKATITICIIEEVFEWQGRICIGGRLVLHKHVERLVVICHKYP